MLYPIIIWKYFSVTDICMFRLLPRNMVLRIKCLTDSAIFIIKKEQSCLRVKVFLKYTLQKQGNASKVRKCYLCYNNCVLQILLKFVWKYVL